MLFDTRAFVKAILIFVLLSVVWILLAVYFYRFTAYDNDIKLFIHIGFQIIFVSSIYFSRKLKRPYYYLFLLASVFIGASVFAFFILALLSVFSVSYYGFISSAFASLVLIALLDRMYGIYRKYVVMLLTVFSALIGFFLLYKYNVDLYIIMLNIFQFFLFVPIAVGLSWRKTVDQKVWTHKGTFAVGGLENIGFDANDLLLVLSGQGIGIFNCITGERVFRDRKEDWPKKFNEKDNTIAGYDILSGQLIKTCGLYGDDFLSKETVDGWNLEINGPYPFNPPIKGYHLNKIFLVQQDKRNKVFIASDSTFRAYGFSNSGNSFIAATSSDLVIWSRI